MAALSLRGQTNVDEFVQTFSGDDRNVADYLADEVLARQPARSESSCSTRRCFDG